MKSLDLNFLLLVLRIPLDLSLNADHKQYKFSETLPEKGSKFFPSRKDSTIAFNLSLMLLQAEVDSITEKQGL